jgi:hypothetical protein
VADFHSAVGTHECRAILCRIDKPIDMELKNEIGADLIRGVLGRLEAGVAVKVVGEASRAEVLQRSTYRQDLRVLGGEALTGGPSGYSRINRIS